MSEKITTIKISLSVKERLQEFGKYGETYNDILVYLLDNCKRRK